LGAVGGLAHATAGEFGHLVLVETAGGGILKQEMGGGQGGQGQSEKRGLHCEGCELVKVVIEVLRRETIKEKEKSSIEELQNREVERTLVSIDFMGDRPCSPLCPSMCHCPGPAKPRENQISFNRS
jgi:hypothetical protein